MLLLFGGLQNITTLTDVKSVFESWLQTFIYETLYLDRLVGIGMLDLWVFLLYTHTKYYNISLELNELVHLLHTNYLLRTHDTFVWVGIFYDYNIVINLHNLCYQWDGIG